MDDALNWDDFGGEEAEAKLLQPGDYTGTITAAQWGHAEWAEKKIPESGGKVCKVKVEIDAAAGYAEVLVTIPVVKERRWQFRVICAAAGVMAPAKDGPAWSPACLVGKRVSVTTSIYTNDRTGESKVQIDRWHSADVDPAGLPPASELVQSKPARRTAAQKADAAPKAAAPDDIPF